MSDRIVRALKLTVLFGSGAICFGLGIMSDELSAGGMLTFAALVFGFLFFLEVERP